MSKWDKYRIEESGNRWDKYKIQAPDEMHGLNVTASEYPHKFMKGDGFLPFVGKSALKGISSIADVPSVLGSGMEAITNAGNKMYGTPVGMYGMGTYGQGKENPPNIRIDENALQTDYSSNIPTSSSLRATLKDKIGLDLEPHPSNPIQNILGNALEVGGSLLSGGALGNLAKPKSVIQNFLGSAKGVGGHLKNAALGSSIGGVSGVLQEGGLAPLESDVLSTASVPIIARFAKGAGAGIKGGKNLISPSKEHIDYKAARELQKYVPEQDVEKVIKNIEEGLPIINPTTAEVAGHSGLARLDRALSPNINGIGERYAANNQLLRRNLQEISPLSTDAEVLGEKISNSLYDNLNQKKQIRTEKTEPYLSALKANTNQVDISGIVSSLKEAGKYEKGKIKSAYTMAEKLLKTNSNPKNILRKFHANDNNSNPIPYEIHTTLSALNAEIESAIIAGNKREASALMNAKKIIEEGSSNIDEIAAYRKAFTDNSKPISAIEENPLMAKFIKRDPYNTEFKLPYEKVPDQIISGSKRDQRALYKEIKNDPAAIKAAKSSVLDKFLKTVETGALDNAGNPKLSNIKANKFLKENKNIISNFFNKDEIRKLHDVNKVLSRRQLISDASRAIGSNTPADLSLLAQLGKEVQHKIPGATFASDFLGSKLQQRMIPQLEKALLEPQYAKKLLQIKQREPWYRGNPYYTPTLTSILNRNTNKSEDK